MELWLVRHGESWGNVDGSQADTSLSTRGQAQARHLSALVHQEDFDLVLTSPLIRARETAAIVIPDTTAIVEERLGEWRTLRDTFLDPASLNAQDWAQLLHGPKTQEESFSDFTHRLDLWLASLPQTGRVIAFTHYAVVRECLRRLSGGKRVLNDVPHCHPFKVARNEFPNLR